MPYTPGSNEGLPQAAQTRLREMRGTADKPALWTSDLSVNEFLLVREAGFEPLGLVMGSSVYHIGFQFAKTFQNQEMEVLTQAMYHARELAMTRMEEEADLLGADGVVGVRLTIQRYEWGEDLAEFMAIGTAIKHSSGEHYRGANNRPFTSDLNGQDFWTLLRAGYRPLSMVMGTCVYHVAHQGFRQAFSQIGRNLEMPNYTQAIYDSRELALSRMQVEAESAGAEGIVGAQVQEESYGWGSHVVEYFAVGTAITPISAEHTHPTTDDGFAIGVKARVLDWIAAVRRDMSCHVRKVDLQRRTHFLSPIVADMAGHVPTYCCKSNQYVIALKIYESLPNHLS